MPEAYNTKLYILKNGHILDWFCLKHSSDPVLLIMDYLEGMVLQNMYILDPVCEKISLKGDI